MELYKQPADIMLPYLKLNHVYRYIRKRFGISEEKTEESLSAFSKSLFHEDSKKLLKEETHQNSLVSYARELPPCTMTAV